MTDTGKSKRWIDEGKRGFTYADTEPWETRKISTRDAIQTEQKKLSGWDALGWQYKNENSSRH